MHIDEGLYQGDCLDLMFGIPDKSIDMILADLPYGTTACSWDEVIPFEPLWSHYKRIIKDNGAIVLFGSEPFSTKLRMSNLEWYRYDWIWEKSKAGNFATTHKQPQKIHENISVFYNKQPIYNPIMENATRKSSKNKGVRANCRIMNISYDEETYYDTGLRYPYSIQFFCNQSGALNNTKRFQPTQKPVALLEYLIKTYTNEGDLVLDNVMGSGSTGVACKNLNRRFIGMELDEKYFKMAKERIEKM